MTLLLASLSPHVYTGHYMTTSTPEFTQSPLYNKAVDGVAEFAATIRQSSQDQVEYWRQLPLLGLLSWGNHGSYLPEDETLFEQGVLSVSTHDSPHRLLGTYVDCETGEILSIPDSFDDRQPASDKLVIQAWLSQHANKGFDAQHIASRFQARVAEQRPSNKTTLESHLQILTPKRLAVARKLGLRAVYQRDSSLQGTELDDQAHRMIAAVDPFYTFV